MANIELSAHLMGSSCTKAAAGANYAVSATCFGRASAANSRAPQHEEQVQAIQPEPTPPKGK